ENGVITVTCHVEHCGGHKKSVTLRGSPDVSGAKNAIQAVGSAVYYLQRYTMMAALGMAQANADEDGKESEPGAFITPDQIEEINALLDETVSGPDDFEKFKSWVGVESLDKILAKDFK